MRVQSIIMAVLFTLLFTEIGFSQAEPSQNEFTFVATEIGEKANIWLPSTIVVKNGQAVHLMLRNVSERDHGFTIEGLGVKEVIAPDGKTRVKFTASSAGVYRFYCHLHKGHIGGQIIVQ